jgi:hypothetical protein
MYAQHQDHTMPFGKHAGKPLGEVPSTSLLWTLRECRLSSGLHLAIGNELRRRNVEVPEEATPAIPTCHSCGGARQEYHWQEDKTGRRLIRAECSNCHRFLAFAPQVSPLTEEADRNASPAPVLDALTRLDVLGVELGNDGKRAWIPAGDYQRVPPDLHALVRQCAHELARMLGNKWAITL